MVFELSRRGGRSDDASVGGEDGRNASLEERKDELRKRLRSIAGKLWNSPNTALGLGYGLTGYGLGLLMQIGKDRADFEKNRPKIEVGGDAIRFINNPLGGVGAITLGNTTTYVGDPGEREGYWKDYWDVGQDPRDHETQHTLQGELLGPLYLPSNILGGLYSVLRAPTAEDPWHGPGNWNETGPQMNPPRPWAGTQP